MDQDTRSDQLTELLGQVRACRLCEAGLPLGPRPVICASVNAKLLIIGQAPGTKVHETGIPWYDASGRRLREWLGMSDVQFYDEQRVAIMPMGLCYPGRGKSGDLPPRKECAPLWHKSVLSLLPEIQLTLLIGQYAQQYYLGKDRLNLTQRVEAWRDYQPDFWPLPHPSPRNQLWLRRHPWFEQQVLPELRARITDI